MKKIIELIRIIFISFEFAFLLILILTYQISPNIMASLGQKFHDNEELWKYIPTIPTGLLIASLSYSWKILTPLSNDTNRPLHEWPDYWKLKFRVILSIIYCGISASSALFIWFYGLQIQKLNLGFMFVSTIGISSIVLLHQILASFVVRELMEP